MPGNNTTDQLGKSALVNAFVFTDIVKSSLLNQSFPEFWPDAFADYVSGFTSIFESERYAGKVYKQTGDGVHARFPSVENAIRACIEALSWLTFQDWGEIGAIRSRFAINVGWAREMLGDYFGSAINRTSRLLSGGHGGQILVTQDVVNRIPTPLPSDFSIKALGNFRFKDLLAPEHVHQICPNGDITEFPPLRTLDLYPNNLPIQPTPLIGRDDDLKALYQEVIDNRRHLITLTGPGGIGKTRLALQLVAELSDHFNDGIYLVNLDDVSAQERIAPAIAEVLGIQIAPERSLQEIIDHLKSKQIALLLDSFDYLIDTSYQIARLLQFCPYLVFVVTSRKRLSIQGEQVYLVKPLALTVPSDMVDTSKNAPPDPALVLLEQQFQARDNHFRITQSNSRLLHSISSWLDGIPLAIVLASGKWPMLSLDELNQRLEKAPLDVLTDGPMDLPAYQRAMRLTIERSVRDCSPDQVTLFHRLSVFVGGFDPISVLNVCFPLTDATTDVHTALGALLHNMLIIRDQSLRGSERFTILHTTRALGAEMLAVSGERDNIVARYIHYFVEYAEQHQLLRTQNEESNLNALREEEENLHEALRYAVETRSYEQGLRLAGALGRFWYRTDRSGEGRTTLQRLLDEAQHMTAPMSVRAKALASLGLLMRAQGAYLQAHTKLEESLALYLELHDDMLGLAECYLHLGNVERDMNNPQRAVELYRASLDCWGELHNDWGISAVYNNLGAIAQDNGELDEAYDYYNEALKPLERSGNARDLAHIRYNLATIAYLRGDMATAEQQTREGITLSRRVNDQEELARAYALQAEFARGKGDYVTARRLYKRADGIYTTLNHNAGKAYTHLHLARLAQDQDQGELAATECDLAENMFRAQYYQWGIIQCNEVKADLARMQGQCARALSLFQDEMKTLNAIGKKALAIHLLEDISRTAHELGLFREAVELLAASTLLLQTHGMALIGMRRQRQERLLEQLQTSVSRAEFDDCWRRGAAYSFSVAIQKSLELRTPEAGSDRRSSTGDAPHEDALPE